MINTQGGLRGLLDRTSFKILTISSKMMPSALFPSISVIWPLQTSFTPAICLYLLNSPNKLQFELGKGVFSYLLNHVVLELDDSFFAHEVFTNFVNAKVVSNIQQEEFVWNYSHFLKSKRLLSRPWKSFNNPAFLLFL